MRRFAGVGGCVQAQAVPPGSEMRLAIPAAPAGFARTAEPVLLLRNMVCILRALVPFLHLAHM